MSHRRVFTLPFFKVTFNPKRGMDRACVYNRGCNFRCRGCTYKLKPSNGVGEDVKELELEEVRQTLLRLKPKRVHFLGGEPTTNPYLPVVARFVHDELSSLTKIGHTNGSGRIPDWIDEASFSIKAYSNQIHQEYTGESNEAVLRNFVDAHARGIAIVASSVLIPGIIDAEEVGRVARFVGGVDRGVTFHITPYVPVPGAPYIAPNLLELGAAVAISKQFVDNVTFSQFKVNNFHKLCRNDSSCKNLQVA